MIDLEKHGRTVVRIRLHPLDWEEIVGYYMPSARAKADELAGLFGAGVELDEARPIGEPVAEWNPEAFSTGTEPSDG